MPPTPDLNSLYQDWLEIPPHRLPPNHYALLGIDDLESDEGVIEAAAKSRSAYLHQIASGPQRKIVQEMMGQVAIARRTLMSTESRDAYNRSLREVDASSSGDSKEGEHAVDANPRRQTSVSSPANRSTKASDRHSSKSPSNWVPHLISVGVLIVVLVGVVVWKRPFTGRSSPVVQRQSEGSGLGSGLDEKFGDVLSEIAGESPSGFTPKAESSPGDSASTIKVINPSKAIEQDLMPDLDQIVEAFPGDIPSRYQSSRGNDWYRVDEAKMIVKNTAGKNSFKLTDTQFHLAAGGAVGLTTSLSAKMRREVQVGFMVDGVRISLRPTNNGIEVIARGRGNGSEVISLAKIKSSGKENRLVLMRDSLEPNRLGWFVQSGAVVRGGQIDAGKIAVSAETAMVIVAPKKKLSRPLSIASVRAVAQPN